MKANNGRIMVLDDNPGDALLIRMAVEQFDRSIDVVAIESGQDILSSLEQYNPNLLMLDLKLPIKSGLEILADLRSHPVWKRIPIVVFTSSKAPLDISGSYECGANCYLVKGNDLVSFGHAVARTVEYWFGTIELPGHCSSGANHA